MYTTTVSYRTTQDEFDMVALSEYNTRDEAIDAILRYYCADSPSREVYTVHDVNHNVVATVVCVHWEPELAKARCVLVLGADEILVYDVQYILDEGVYDRTQVTEVTEQYL